jgi:hypothetical protein
MNVGDLVRHDRGYLGVITCVDPENLGDIDEVEVAWSDGDVCNMSVWDLDKISE